MKEIRKNKTLFLMLTPGVILYLLFNYLPMFGLVLAFKKINYRQSIFLSPWSGLDNFKFMLKSSDLLHAVINTLAYNAVFLFVGMVMAVALAVALDLIRSKMAKKVYQTIMIMPHFLSWVIVAYRIFKFGKRHYEPHSHADARTGRGKLVSNAERLARNSYYCALLAGLGI